MRIRSSTNTSLFLPALIIGLIVAIILIAGFICIYKDIPLWDKIVSAFTDGWTWLQSILRSETKIK